MLFLVRHALVPKCQGILPALPLSLPALALPTLPAQQAASQPFPQAPEHAFVPRMAELLDGRWRLNL